MPSDNEKIAISKAVADLALLALEHGMASRRDGAILVPFVLLESGGTRYMHSFAAASDEQAVADATTYVSREPVSTNACVIAYDGTITIEGTAFDAILAIGCEQNAPSSYVFAQRYDDAVTPAALIGSPAFIGTNDPILGTTS